MNPAIVRPATPADEAGLFDLLVALHRHNGAGWQTPYDPATVMARIEVGTRPSAETVKKMVADGVPIESIALRTNPADGRLGWIGVIGPEGGRLIGTVGLFIEPAAWFAVEAVALVELWLFVRPDARKRSRYERDLFAFADFQHQEMKGALAKTGYRFACDLQTGFMHQGPRFNAMARLWRRMSGAQPVGMLFRKP